MIVLTNGGKRATAFGIHGLTATLLVAAGLDPGTGMNEATERTTQEPR